MAERRYSTLTKLGLSALAVNSAIVIYRSRGDAGSVAFVLAADAALLLLSLCRLRERERGAQIGMGGRRYPPDLVNMAFGVVACNSALAHHQAGGGDDVAGSLALVLVAYAGFLTLTWLFLRRFDDGRARAAGQ